MVLQVINSISDALNIKFYEDASLRDRDEFEKLNNISFEDNYNRDGVHFNRKIHDIIAKSFFKMITER
jgi:hypothetical protein